MMQIEIIAVAYAADDDQHNCTIARLFDKCPRPVAIYHKINIYNMQENLHPASVSIDG